MTDSTKGKTDSTDAERSEPQGGQARRAVTPANEIDGSTIEAQPASETNDPRYQSTGVDAEGATEAAGAAATDFNADRDLDALNEDAGSKD